MSADPEWLQAAIGQDAPFAPDAFDEKPPAPPSDTRPRIDLKEFFTEHGHTKYTCPFMKCEFDSSEIKDWWRKPKNKHGMPAIPVCPKCGSASAMIGWGVDWTEVDKDWAAWNKMRAEKYSEMEVKRQEDMRLKFEREAREKEEEEFEEVELGLEIIPEKEGV